VQGDGARKGCGRAGVSARARLMARRSAQSVLKRAREQARREKREVKQAKKDARAAERRGGGDPSANTGGTDPEGVAG
jgi:hypothetical protein